MLRERIFYGLFMSMVSWSSLALSWLISVLLDASLTPAAALAAAWACSLFWARLPGMTPVCWIQIERRRCNQPFNPTLAV